MTVRFAPYRIPEIGGALVEFPLTVASILRTDLLFGAGYLRLFPYPLVVSRPNAPSSDLVFDQKAAPTAITNRICS